MRRQRGRVTLTRVHARSCVKIEKELTLKIPPEDGYVVPYCRASGDDSDGAPLTVPLPGVPLALKSTSLPSLLA